MTRTIIQIVSLLLQMVDFFTLLDLLITKFDEIYKKYQLS